MRTGYSVTLVAMSIGLCLAPLERWRAHDVPLIAATHQSLHSKTEPLHLAVRIDGSKRPDAISDELAYRHFFKTIIVNKTATPKDIAVRDSLLSKVGLSQTDRT